MLQGTHRIRPPAETLEWALRHAPDMGITRIANVTGLDRVGIPVVMVYRPNSKAIAVSQGKGISMEAAKASGLMEAIETYHAENMTLPLRRESWRNLDGAEPVVDIERLPPMLESSFDPDTDVYWVRGRELMTQQPIWVPYEMVHTDYTLPFPEGSGAFMASSNGLASGNHLLEAVNHGITEVIERDAGAHWQARLGMDPGYGRLDLETIDDPVCRDLLQRFDAAGIDVALWDATTDVGVASIECWIMDRQGAETRRSYMGSGCHPARHVALSRALSEAAQDRLAVISGARDDLLAEDFNLPEDDQIQQARDDLFATRGEGRSFHDIADFSAATLEEDHAFLLQRLAGAGVTQVVMVDLTCYRKFNIPVARVIIPGLEGPSDHPAYVPGPRICRLTEAQS